MSLQGIYTLKYFDKVLALSIILYLFKAAFWPLTYFFFITYAWAILLFILNFNWKFNFPGFIKSYLLPFVLFIIILIWSIPDKYFLNEIIQKDIIRILILFSFFILLHWNLENRNTLLDMIFITRIIVIITVLITIINLVKQPLTGFIQSDILNRLNISNEMALSADYNYFSLFLLLGFTFLNMNDVKIILNRTLVFLLNTLIIINVAFSGSRRGMVALILLVLYLIFIRVKTGSLKHLTRLIPSVSVFLSALLLLGFVLYKTSSQDKITNTVLRYGSFIGIQDKSRIESFLWGKELKRILKDDFVINDKFFERNPGYWNQMEADGTVVSFVNTPYGKGAKVLRGKSENTGGISLSYIGPAILYYANHTYNISFKIKFLKGDFNSFSVGWYTGEGDGGRNLSNILGLKKEISPLGDGWYNSTSTYTFIDNHIGPIGFINSVFENTEFIIADFQVRDMDYDQSLPKFDFEIDGAMDHMQYLNNINPPVLPNNNLIVNHDFSHGFKYWNYTVDSLKISVEYIDSMTVAVVQGRPGENIGWSLLYSGRNIQFRAGDLYQLKFKVKCLTDDRIPFSAGFGIQESDESQSADNLLLSIDSIGKGWLDVTARYRFRENYSDILFPIHNQIGDSKFYITDITLNNIDSEDTQTINSPGGRIIPEPKNDPENKKFYSDRKERYLYAVSLFKNEYSWSNRIIGHGFDYLKWYGKKYIGSYDSNDWPHNPVITVLLYSGIAGLFLYLLLILDVLWIYYRNTKSYTCLFICFLLTFYFSIFSGGNPFDPPIMGFFMLVPYYIKSVVKKNYDHNFHKDVQDSYNRYQ